MRLAVAFALAVFAGATGAFAQGGLRAGDEVFSQAALTQTLTGQAIEFYDGSIARYRADGRYSYVYRDGGRPNLGYYEVTEDSTVCVRFDNGFSRCDTFVRNGARLLLIIAEGERFPIRTSRALDADDQ